MKRILACMLLLATILMTFVACNGATQGSEGKDGVDGKDGKDGVSIIKTEIIDGELWITYSNAPETPVNVGKVSVGNNGDDEKDQQTATSSETSEGLEFALNVGGKDYTLVGIGTCKDLKIVINKHNGLPVTKIGGEALKGCTEFAEISLPNTITSIENSAFSGCTGISSITIPDSVTSIGNYAFYECTGLTSVTIPDSVTSIGDKAFKECTGLTSVTIPDSVTSIGDDAFAYCEGLTSITIPNSVTSIGASAFAYCEGLTSVTIGNSVTSIGEGAFSYCTGLTSVTIPDSVTSIGASAFYDTAYYNNESNWDNGVLYIGKHLINAKTSISGAYTAKQGTKTIANSVFYGCDGLTSVTIPDSVTSIGVSAFGACYGLTSVTIGNSVTSIGYRAFEGCTGLTTINFQGTKAEWKAIKKGYRWNYSIGNYTVKCTDGDIAKADDN